MAKDISRYSIPANRRAPEIRDGLDLDAASTTDAPSVLMRFDGCHSRFLKHQARLQVILAISITGTYPYYEGMKVRIYIFETPISLAVMSRIWSSLQGCGCKPCLFRKIQCSIRPEVFEELSLSWMLTKSVRGHRYLPSKENQRWRLFHLNWPPSSPTKRDLQWYSVACFKRGLG